MIDNNDYILQETFAKKILDRAEDPETIPFVCKRERSEDCALSCEPELKTFSLFQNKRSKTSDPNSSNANGSEDSTTTSQDPRRALLEFPLLDSIEAKECQPPTALPSFDAATLEKSVPPGYLKFISNLENEILNVSMEKETLKIELMRAQAVIDILQSRIEVLSKENGGFKAVG